MNLDLVWRGGFVDVAPHWLGRGCSSSVAGYSRVSPVDGMALQVLESPDTPWVPYSQAKINYERDKVPADIKKEVTIGVPHPDYDFQGYRLDAERFPTFNYAFKGLKVSDHFTTADNINGFVRTLTFEGKAPAKTFLLVGSGGTYEKSSDGWLAAGDNFSIKVDSDDLVIRESDPEGSAGARKELLVPVKGTGSLKIHYRWNTEIGGKPKK